MSQGDESGSARRPPAQQVWRAGAHGLTGTALAFIADAMKLRLALIEFRHTYNESWLIERHGHRSPAQFRRDRMDTMPLAA